MATSDSTAIDFCHLSRALKGAFFALSIPMFANTSARFKNFRSGRSSSKVRGKTAYLRGPQFEEIKVLQLLEA